MLAKRPLDGDGKKVELFGHVCRMNNSGLKKQVVFDMVDGIGSEED